MSAKTYETFSTKQTPQSEPIPGKKQVKNSAGGYVFTVDKWATLQRFLVLGTEGGTYYIKEQTLTRDNALNVLACIDEDPHRTVAMIVEISDSGRAPKNDPAIFALALVASHKEPEVRKIALDALPSVCRIPTHLFHFLTYVRKHRGVSRGLRRAITNWYARWDANQFAYEAVKYQSRDGWANKDALRISHGPTKNDAALRWVVGATLGERSVTRKNAGGRIDTYPAVGELPEIIAAFEEAKTATPTRVRELIRRHKLTHEMIPSAMLTEPETWEALLDHMPPHALLRNVGNMSKSGFLKPMSNASKAVLKKLEAMDEDYLRKKRMHPIAVLIAQKIYAQGKGMKGSGTWTPVQPVVDALDAMFYRAFGAVESTGKRQLYAVDCSGSMYGSMSEYGGGGFSNIPNMPLCPMEGAVVMAMVCARREQEFHFMGFSTGLIEIGISPTMRLPEAMQKVQRAGGGGTDCARPMLWAMDQRMDVDTFVVLTDNETWAGSIHPTQALAKYRSARNLVSKLAVVAMVPTSFSIADPSDPGMMDFVGFDTNTPQAISEFVVQ